MASKYLQKYQVPEGFYDILHEFTREVLRAQPDDILDYAANYFEHKSEGREYYYESKANVQKPKQHQPKTYNPTPHSNYSEQAKRVVEASNARAVVEAEQQTHYEPAKREGSAHSSKPVRTPSGDPNAHRPQTSNSVASEKPNDTSKVSYHSKKSDISHPEEKQITKEFVDDLYSSAMQKAIGSVSQGNQEEEEGEREEVVPQNQEVEQTKEAVQPQSAPEAEEVVLDGPVEEYENVALKIQSVFRGQQVRKAKKQ